MSHSKKDQNLNDEVPNYFQQNQRTQLKDTNQNSFYQKNSSNYHSNNSSQLKYQNLENLPSQVAELIKTNKYLKKQNLFLTQQLQEKETQIQALKNEIYQSIIEETEDKIHCLKIIEEEANARVKQMFQQRIAIFQQNDEVFQQKSRKIKDLQLELKKQKKANQILATNIVELKDFIITAMKEKDIIIHQLKSMILSSDETDTQQICEMIDFEACKKNKICIEENPKERIHLKVKRSDKMKDNYSNLLVTKNYEIEAPKQVKPSKAKIVKNL